MDVLDGGFLELFCGDEVIDPEWNQRREEPAPVMRPPRSRARDADSAA